MKQRTPSSRKMHVPLMYAFRDAFEKKDAAKKLDIRENGDRVISQRGSMSRLGAKEADLKQNLAIDLAALVNTINLASTEELDGRPRVRSSILNYGLPDIGHLTSEELAVDDIAAQLRDALVCHEPRLERDSLRVARAALGNEDMTQRVRFEIEAEMLARPVNVALQFVAEIDVHSGKMKIARLGNDRQA